MRTWAGDSSPHTYKTLDSRSARAAAACSSRVDLPMPGSPPMSTSDPWTSPPPSTRSNSETPVASRSSAAASTSPRRTVGDGAAIADEEAEDPVGSSAS